MNPSRTFILRPVATILFMAAILISGLIAWRMLPVAALPQVDYPTIQVVTTYPGASPEVVASTITAPLERQFGQMPGLSQMTSASSQGVSVVTLQFVLSMTLDVAEQEVQAKINGANNLLPNDLPYPPLYSKVNPADLPVMTIAVTSESLSPTKLEDLADTRIAQKLSQVSGVGLVSLNGVARPAVRIQANSRALASMGITLEKLRQTITDANVNASKGSLDGPWLSSIVDGNDQLKSADQYKSIIIAHENGSPVRLSDVAEVVDGAENAFLAAWTGKTPAVILTVQKQPGANVIQVADKIKEILPQIKGALPGSVDVDIIADRTDTIRQSITDVEHELVFAIALVVLVVFLFLRNATATLIPAIAVPLSIVGTFCVMYLAGFSVNNLTLMALTIATGFVVDDAIVMVENIARFIEDGEEPLQAALKGAKQIGFTIISLTVSLIAVLIPLLFMGDVIGRLFREFAVTLAVAIIISAVISLTLTPMMSARLLKHTPEEEQGRLFKATGAFFDRMIAMYATALQWVLLRRKLTLLVAVGTVVLTAGLYVAVPKGFFPVTDTSIISGVSETDQSISFRAMTKRHEQLIDVILADPAVESLSSFIGVDATNAAPNNARLLIHLKPKKDRENIHTVMARLQAASEQIPGLSLYLQAAQDISIDSTTSKTQYQFTLQANDTPSLNEWTPKLIDKLETLPEIRDVATNLQNKAKMAYVVIDRESASKVGVSVKDIANALYNAFGQRQISTIYTQTNQYRVVLEVVPDQRRNIDSLRDIFVESDSGQMVPLHALASVEMRSSPLVINHLNQFPTATISFNLAEGVSLSEAVEAIGKAQQELEMPLTVRTKFQGAAMAFKESLSSTLWLIVAAIVTMYIVLGILYESYIHPVTILSTLPSAGIGALAALMIAGHDLSVIAIIGIILLIGIVKKNAIMMIDFALTAEREQGLSPLDAIYQACLLRFRPILMTTMAALLGALPLMLATGIGSEMRNPLGLTMVGGLMVSQVLTLFTTPVIYLAFDSLAKRYRGEDDEEDGAGGRP